MVCYILYSNSLDKYYIGITTESIYERLLLHNSSGYGQHYTSQVTDWEIFHFIECSCTKQMIQIEKHLKKMKSRIYIENLRKYQETTEKLLIKYSCN